MSTHLEPERSEAPRTRPAHLEPKDARSGGGYGTHQRTKDEAIRCLTVLKMTPVQVQRRLGLSRHTMYTIRKEAGLVTESAP